MRKIKDVAGTVFRNWWKAILIVLTAGLVLTGFSFSFGALKCQKDGIKVPGILQNSESK
jgi:hypothetical protein